MLTFKNSKFIFVVFLCIFSAFLLPQVSQSVAGILDSASEIEGKGEGKCVSPMPDQEIILPNNTTIRVTVYGAKLPKEGKAVKAKVFESIYVGNREVIRANTPVEAYVKGSGVAKMVDFVSVEAVDGQIIGLRSLSDNPKKYMAAKVGVSALFGLSSLVGLRDDDDENDKSMSAQRDKYDEPKMFSETYGKAVVDGDYSVMTVNPCDY